MKWGPLEIAGAIVVVGGAVALLVGALRWFARAGKNLADLKDDLLGEPARHGVPERPGVMRRLASIEAELRPNGGGSLRDAVNRLEAGQQAADGKLAALESRLTALESSKPVTVNVNPGTSSSNVNP